MPSRSRSLRSFSAAGLEVTSRREPQNPHQRVDRHAFRRFRQTGQCGDQPRAILLGLTQPDDPAAAQFDPCVAHMGQGVEPILIDPGGDDLAVMLGRRVEVVVVVIQAGVA